VYYEVYGPDDGKLTPILFLQGLAGELVGWKILTQYLSSKRQCILMDNRDCGKGDRSHGGYTIEDMADDAAGLLLHLGKTKVNVVGHSMGGCIALALAIRHPSVIHKLFLASTNARPGRYHGFHPIAAWKYLAESGAPRSVIAAQFTAMCMSARFIEDHPKQPLYEWPQVSQNPAEFVRQCDAFLRFDAVDQLPRLECPLLVYVGDQDILAPVVNSREIHELVPGSLLYINEGFSHASLFEDVGHSIQMIDNFLL
jgi:3-oxoadipate enol-lactonase